MYTMYSIANINNIMMQNFGQHGIFSIDGFLYNQSDIPQDPYAKPNIGMLNRSKNEIGMDWTDGYYVGDTIEDVKMAIKFGKAAAATVIRAKFHIISVSIQPVPTIKKADI